MRIQRTSAAHFLFDSTEKEGTIAIMKRRMISLTVLLGMLLIISTGFATSAYAASSISTSGGKHHSTVAPAHILVPARALASCSGEDCDGKNPSYGVTGCWDRFAYIVHGISIPYGTVSLWYSPTCGTNWSETIESNGTDYIADANITRADGLHYDTIAYAYDLWSPMVYAPYASAQACGSINNARGGCTGFW